jgi:3',5'-cyclic AMP phosphodiesterase CpdA
MRFVHLTDPHLTPPGTALYGSDPAARLAAAIAHINEHALEAECVVLTGDLAHQGRAESYAVLAELLSGLRPPCHLLVGNHDDRANLRRQFPELAGEGNEFLHYAVDYGAHRFVMLDTLLDDSHQGGLCENRLDWLAATLEEAAGRPVFLFLHHPPFRLEGGERFAEILASHDIRHMFYGHIHRPMHGAWNGIGFTCQRGTNHQIHMTVTPSPGPMIGCHEPPAYGLITLRDGLVHVHDQHFLDDSPRFRLRNRRAREASDLDELAAAAAADAKP